MTTTIRLSGPPDVLTVLPYQLGFHPRECVVVVSLHGSRMGLVQRIDLPPPEHVGQAVAAMIAPLRQDIPTAVLLIGYEEHEGQSRAMLDEMADACEAYEVRVDDRMVVRGGRWFDLDCTRSCCPPAGLPLPPASTVPAVSEFVGREIYPLPDRASLAELLEPNEPLLSTQLGEVSQLADEWLRLRRDAKHPANPEHTEHTGPKVFRESELALWSSVLCEDDDAPPIREMSPQDLAILAVSLTDVDLRDGLIAWLCPSALPPDLIDPILSVQMCEALPRPSWLGMDGGDGGGDQIGYQIHDGGVDGDAEIQQVIGRQRVERRLCELSAALPDAWAVATLTLLASFAWWRGDGALTRVALDRALRLDPYYRLAQLLERMVDLAIRPARASA